MPQHADLSQHFDMGGYYFAHGLASYCPGSVRYADEKLAGRSSTSRAAKLGEKRLACAGLALDEQRTPRAHARHCRRAIERASVAIKKGRRRLP